MRLYTPNTVSLIPGIDGDLQVVASRSGHFLIDVQGARPGVDGILHHDHGTVRLTYVVCDLRDLLAEIAEPVEFRTDDAVWHLVRCDTHASSPCPRSPEGSMIRDTFALAHRGAAPATRVTSPCASPDDKPQVADSHVEISLPDFPSNTGVILISETSQGCLLAKAQPRPIALRNGCHRSAYIMNIVARETDRRRQVRHLFSKPRFRLTIPTASECIGTLPVSFGEGPGVLRPRNNHSRYNTVCDEVRNDIGSSYRSPIVSDNVHRGQ